LVEWQLRVAAGEALPAGEPRAPNGHAVEVRLYAEDADNDFLPSSGKLAMLHFPEGVRVDTGVEKGDMVSPHYDPMIAKLIVHGEDRAAAFAAMRDALDGTVAIGPRTNLPFLRAVVTHQEVLDGRHDTDFVDREIGALTGGSVSAQAVADAAAVLITPPPAPAPQAGWADPWSIDDGFRITGDAAQSVALWVDGAARSARVVGTGDGQTVWVDGLQGNAEGARVVRADGDAFALEAGRAVRVSLVDQLARRPEPEGGGQAVAPMHGRIVAVFVKVGDEVAAGAKLFSIEAMKMEHTVKAAVAGVVDAVHASAGDQVAEGAEVIAVTPTAES
ncbi:MAG: biotin/lipoyl-containing protein, partial [Pseudomonadota bacterium]